MRISVLFLAFLCALSCKEEATQNQQTQTQENSMTEVQTAIAIDNAVIYEANIRQYSPEGTFNEFTKDIPVLKQLGVKIIWVMPIHPISMKRRKATGGQFVSEIENEQERKKYLGSYYAVADFKGINPEFGTLQDFKNLVATAHDNDISVIIDWVPNHTGWDHHWIAEHPDWYTQNDQDEIIHPKDTDWTDVADLNYSNQDMRGTMIDDMKYWLDEANIDGFRCDMAGMVPLDFWEQAIPQLRAKKDIFMLAEAWEPQLMNDGLFDMAYGWETHHIMNRIAKGENNANDLKNRFDEIDRLYKNDDILMNFVSNHDENSWNGSLAERMPKNKNLFTAMSYVLPGMPLIYTGQEYDLAHRLKFFEKDSIPKERSNYFTFLAKLGHLKNTSKALHTGEDSASFENLTRTENSIIVERKKSDEEFLFIGNLSNETINLEIPRKGDYLEYLTEEELSLTDDPLNLGPWQFYLLLKK